MVDTTKLSKCFSFHGRFVHFFKKSTRGTSYPSKRRTRFVRLFHMIYDMVVYKVTCRHFIMPSSYYVIFSIFLISILMA